MSLFQRYLFNHLHPSHHQDRPGHHHLNHPDHNQHNHHRYQAELPGTSKRERWLRVLVRVRLHLDVREGNQHSSEVSNEHLSLAICKSRVFLQIPTLNNFAKSYLTNFDFAAGASARCQKPQVQVRNRRKRPQNSKNRSLQKPVGISLR